MKIIAFYFFITLHYYAIASFISSMMLFFFTIINISEYGIKPKLFKLNFIWNLFAFLATSYIGFLILIEDKLFLFWFYFIPYISQIYQNKNFRKSYPFLKYKTLIKKNKSLRRNDKVTEYSLAKNAYPSKIIFLPFLFSIKFGSALLAILLLSGFIKFKISVILSSFIINYIYILLLSFAFYIRKSRYKLIEVKDKSIYLSSRFNKKKIIVISLDQIVLIVEATISIPRMFYYEETLTFLHSKDKLHKISSFAFPESTWTRLKDSLKVSPTYIEE